MRGGAQYSGGKDIRPNKEINWIGQQSGDVCDDRASAYELRTKLDLTLERENIV